VKRTLWICFPRYRWYENSMYGCFNRSGHEDCGWYVIERWRDDE